METVKVIYSQPRPKVKTVELIRLPSGRRECSVVGYLPSFDVKFYLHLQVLTFWLPASSKVEHLV